MTPAKVAILFIACNVIGATSNVRQTTNTIIDRSQGHISDIIHISNTTVARHFTSQHNHLYPQQNTCDIRCQLVNYILKFYIKSSKLATVLLTKHISKYFSGKHRTSDPTGVQGFTAFLIQLNTCT